MKWNLKKFRQSGFSLLEVLIAAAAMGGLALIATQLTSDVDKTKKHFETSTDMTGIKSNIGSMLVGSESCKNTFSGLSLATLPRSVPNVRNSSNSIVYSTGVEIGKTNIKINSFNIVSKSLNNLGAGKTGTFRFEIEFEKIQTLDTSHPDRKHLTNFKGGKTIKTSMDVSVTTDAAEQIQNCYNDLLSAQETWCSLVGGTFNAIARECTLAAYTNFAAVNANDTAAAQKIAVSQRYITNLITDMLDKRYVNVNGGAGGPATETLGDALPTAGRLTIGNDPVNNIVGFLSKVGVGTITPEAAFQVTSSNNGAAATPGVSLGISGGYGSVEIKGGSGAFIDFGPTSNDFGGRILYDNATNTMRMSASGMERLIVSNGPTHVLTVVGNAIATAWETNSDKRFKKNIETVQSPVEKLLGIRGVTFDWRKEDFPERNFPDRKTYGFIAQELEKVVPELVSTDNNGFKSVQYQNMTSILVEGFKEAWKKIKDLAYKVAGLEEVANELKKENEKLVSRVKELEEKHQALKDENKAIRDFICVNRDKNSKVPKICK